MKSILTAAIAFLSIAFCANAAAQQKPYPFKVAKTGTGTQAIFFIPGFASAGEVWQETVSRYENSYTCYVLTMAGFAGIAPQGEATFKGWEAGIAQYIQDQKLEKPIVVGHSMGGGLALALAADYPKLLGKVVVVDALPCLSALINPAFKAAENPDCTETVTQMTALSDAQFYTMQKSGIPRLLQDTSMQEQVVGWSVKTDRKTFAQMFCDFSNTDLREKISSVTCPALILLESYFTTVKPEIEAQYKNLKGADLRYATKGLHFIMYDDKEWYFSQLKGFLAGK